MYLLMYMSLDKKPKLFQSTTDVKSYWRGPGNQTNKNPKPVGVNNYEKKFRNDRYKDIDPRPVNLRGPKPDKMDAFLGKQLNILMLVKHLRAGYTVLILDAHLQVRLKIWITLFQ